MILKETKVFPFIVSFDQVILSLYQVISSGVLHIVDGCYIKLLIAQSKNSSSCCATLCKSCNLSGESSTFNCSFSFLHGEIYALLNLKAFHLSIRILATALRMALGQGTSSSFASTSSICFPSASLTWTASKSLACA